MYTKCFLKPETFHITEARKSVSQSCGVDLWSCRNVFPFMHSGKIHHLCIGHFFPSKVLHRMQFVPRNQSACCIMLVRENARVICG